MSGHACSGSCVHAWLVQYNNAEGGRSTCYRASPHMTKAEALRASPAFVQANFVAAYRCGVIA